MPGAGWRAIFEQRTTTAQEALQKIRSGSSVYIGSGCGVPLLLLEALGGIASRVSDLQILHGMTLGVVGSTDPVYADRFRHNAFFVSDGFRVAVTEGRADYTPVLSSNIPSLFASGRMPVDVALIQVSPPDEQGYCSLGISVGITKPATDAARYVVAEVNPRMPRTFGASLVHVGDIDAFVPVDRPLVEVAAPPIDDVTYRIAHHCARLIEDGATLRMGANAIAAAVAAELIDAGRRDLGIHSDYMSDALMDLMVGGVVTNARKEHNAGRSVACRCIGSRRLYDFVHNNPQVELHTTADVCDPFNIAKHERMVAIVRGHQVDLMGQVSDGVGGGSFHGGFGGRADFVRGAARSRRGKPIVVIPSTTADGSDSNIKVSLDLGSEVVASGADVHYVVTEWGTAALHGRSIRERAVALIHIAHPRFRESLMAEAKRARFVYQDSLLTPGDAAVYPDHVEATVEFEPGVRLFFRPAIPDDERGVQAFIYRLGERSVRYRFHGEVRVITHALVQPWITVDYLDSMTIVGLLDQGGPEEGEVVAIGQYDRSPDTNRAEVAFVTLDAYQNLGIGTWLLQSLGRYARQCGIEGFYAEVLRGNHQMLRVFQKSGLPMRTSFDDDIYTVELDL